jgi:peptidoglycan/xylan/chitin deacetylase (PgdA/CDA1 family)
MEKYPNINILINVPTSYIPKAEFVLRTYCYILRLNPKFFYGSHSEGIHIYYGPHNSNNYPIRIYFDSQTADFFNQMELYPLENVNFCKYNNEHIPFLFSQNGEVFSFLDNFCVIRKDIIASGFYFLSCWHEYIISNKGIAKGRVDYKQSLQYRWDFTELPVVDVYCQILFRIIGMFMPEFLRDIRWNNKHSFTISLSHDIDYWHYWTPKHFWETYQYNILTIYKRPLNALYKIVGHTVDKLLCNNPWKKIKHIIRVENRLNVESTWFLFAKSDFEDERQNYIKNVTYREHILDLLSQKEVGLHGSPDSAFDYDTLVGEIAVLKNLGFNPTGYRTHYLHFDYQKSFSILEQAGIKYDSTLGYWENIGYRAGISFPFYPFNLKENRTFRVLEIPLIVMDTTLHSSKAMNLNAISAYNKLIKMVVRAEKYQSHMSLLWHNTTFDVIDFPFWGKLYWTLIKKAKKHNGWITSLNHIYDEWVNISY